jgi:uncharacterized protein
MAKINGLLVALSPALLCLCGALAAAASFPCSKASTAQEKAICIHPELSLLDEQLASAYQTTRKQLSAGGAARVQVDQRAWAKRLRVMCPDGKAIARCLQGEYNIRLEQLHCMQELGGMVFFPRVKDLISDSKVELEDGEPRASTGRLSWPAILQPTPQQRKWNAAMRAQAVHFFNTTAGDFLIAGLIAWMWTTATRSTPQATA